jgi:predicted enzyme related to lactoylglutathione lyase
MLDGQSVAGMYPMTDEIPAEIPSHWRVYFMVGDVDAAVARAEELGGSVLYPAMDIGMGRYAVLADPTGAAFAVMSFK